MNLLPVRLKDRARNNLTPKALYTARVLLKILSSSPQYLQIVYSQSTYISITRMGQQDEVGSRSEDTSN
jgi:hypothetical protein